MRCSSRRRRLKLGLRRRQLSDRPHRPILDGWTLAAAVAARTEGVQLNRVTLNIPYRYPAVLAKEAATLDIISNGRLDLCLGAGGEGNRHLYDSIGVPLAPPKEPRVRGLREYTAILRGLWANETFFSYEGRAIASTTLQAACGRCRSRSRSGSER